MTALEIRLIAYGVLALAIVSSTAYATHRLDSAHYEALQAEVAQDNANRQDAARIALQDQIDKANAQDAANAKTISQLMARASSAESDAAYARRLLAAAAESAAGSSAKQQVPDKSGATATGGTQGGGSLEGTVASAIGECERNADRLDALIAELKPQL